MRPPAGDQPRASPWQSPPVLFASFPQKLTLPEPSLDFLLFAVLNNLQLSQAQGQFFPHLLGGLTFNEFTLAIKTWDVEFRDLGECTGMAYSSRIESHLSRIPHRDLLFTSGHDAFQRGIAWLIGLVTHCHQTGWAHVEDLIAVLEKTFDPYHLPV